MRLLFILLLALCSYGQNLDSMVSKGQEAINRVHHFKGVLSDHRDAAVNKMRDFRPFISQQQDIEDLKINVAKLTVICDNLQKQSDGHSDNQDFLLKIIEIIIGGIVTIAMSYLGLKLSKGKKEGEKE
jgi:hypothetical protein